MSQQDETTLKGIPVSAGIAYGPVYLLLPEEVKVPCYSVRIDQIKGEEERFAAALEKTRKEIAAIRAEIVDKVGEEEARIFDAHQMILEDQVMLDEVIEELRKKQTNVECCFQTIVRRAIKAFKRIDDTFFAERVADVQDVSRRLLLNLLGEPTAPFKLHLEEKAIVVAKDLTPSDTASLDTKKVQAIANDTGGPTGHAAIMARSMAIPAVIGLHDLCERVKPGDTLLVNGYQGEVIINPTEATLLRYETIQQKQQRLEAIFATALPLLTETRDGKILNLSANIGSFEDAKRAQSLAADGVGLFRTEEIYLGNNRFLNEEEQFEIYRNTVQALEPKEVVFRTLDLGGDKQLRLNHCNSVEDNPFMGFRSIRFCLKNVELFKDQLRAILRASAFGYAKIMYPMISSVQELVTANKILEECKEELAAKAQSFDSNIQTGVLIEIPGAAAIIDLLAEHCFFFSIGTNDLIQYLLAVDRNNDQVADLYSAHNPAVLRTINSIIKAAQKREVPVGICGEIAGDPYFAPLLFGMGADMLSISPSILSEIKYLLRRIKFSEAKQLVETILDLTSSEEILTELQSFYRDKIGDLTLQDTCPAVAGGQRSTCRN